MSHVTDSTQLTVVFSKSSFSFQEGLQIPEKNIKSIQDKSYDE